MLGYDYINVERFDEQAVDNACEALVGSFPSGASLVQNREGTAKAS